MTGTFSVTNEISLYRAPSIVESSRNNTFMNAVRERDGECVITGYKFEGYIGLEAAHIFPLAYGMHWT